MTNLQKPIPLDRAGAWRTYIGGKLIDALHGIESEDSNFPEEWIMSLVRARNSGREHIVEGLSMVKGTEISLKELIEAHPMETLGHPLSGEATLGVLVKLLDSAERLTIQVHPTKETAKALFQSDYGKTECWHILGGREINGEKPCIYFGFKEGITRAHWKKVFDEQDIDAMLDCLHKFEVKPGDTFFIEGGIPHAIGPGCFLVEVQEPTDYTIRTERKTPSGLEVSDFMCHQGLGFDKMFDIFTYQGYSREETLKRWCIKPQGRELISYADTEMFRLEMMEITQKESFFSNGVFSGIFILEGAGKINGESVTKGDQFFIPAACEEFTAEGNMKMIRFYGPKEVK